ncbi:abortive phage resistance protein [Thalassoporum mexicanum PCC 7367]|uniref:RloB family protein n=1 Tax=Thalassoporum mexicanum TaxID=3457544 RepID=UPI00029FE43D|nr:RloB family protein [Pseudanabaena sp. PCC 7367]AFY69903.1 abortive phage resistance protein [Pseudanabaena sp. PCC 7367]
MARGKKTARGYKNRTYDTKETRKSFLIVCEGTKTEKNYFESFKLKIKAENFNLNVKGLGKDPQTLVREALNIKQAEEKKGEEYDQVWCVFDRDSWTSENFNNALQNASIHDIQVAYSNEAFELWYILHFEFLNTGIPRSDYKNKLKNHLEYSYKKNSDSMYEELLNKQEVAIANAKRLLRQYNPTDPEKDNPSTTVHLLVEELNKNLPGQNK